MSSSITDSFVKISAEAANIDISEHSERNHEDFSSGTFERIGLSLLSKKGTNDEECDKDLLKQCLFQWKQEVSRRQVAKECVADVLAQCLSGEIHRLQSTQTREEMENGRFSNNDVPLQDEYEPPQRRQEVEQSRATADCFVVKIKNEQLSNVTQGQDKILDRTCSQNIDVRQVADDHIKPKEKHDQILALSSSDRSDESDPLKDKLYQQLIFVSVAIVTFMSIKILTRRR